MAKKRSAHNGVVPSEKVRLFSIANMSTVTDKRCQDSHSQGVPDEDIHYCSSF